MKSPNREEYALQQAIETKVVEHLNNNDMTALLLYFAESLEQESTEQTQRIGAKVFLSLLVLLLFYLLLDFSSDGTRGRDMAILFVLLCFVLKQPTASRKYFLLLESVSQVLQNLRNYTGGQKALIIRIAHLVQSTHPVRSA